MSFTGRDEDRDGGQPLADADLPSPSSDIGLQSQDLPPAPELDLDRDEFKCDEFRLYSFKIAECPFQSEHDWTQCPYLHPGEKARRRDPRDFKYCAEVCPDFRKSSCKRGDTCEFAHGVFEAWLHPSRYRTQVCKDGSACDRRVCFFAHSLEQLRQLPEEEDDSASTTMVAAPAALSTNAVTEPFSPLHGQAFKAASSLTRVSGDGAASQTSPRPTAPYRTLSIAEAMAAAAASMDFPDVETPPGTVTPPGNLRAIYDAAAAAAAAAAAGERVAGGHLSLLLNGKALPAPPPASPGAGAASPPQRNSSSSGSGSCREESAAAVAAVAAGVHGGYDDADGDAQEAGEARVVAALADAFAALTAGHAGLSSGQASVPRGAGHATGAPFHRLSVGSDHPPPLYRHQSDTYNVSWSPADKLAPQQHVVKQQAPLGAPPSHRARRWSTVTPLSQPLSPRLSTLSSCGFPPSHGGVPHSPPSQLLRSTSSRPFPPSSAPASPGLAQMLLAAAAHFEADNGGCGDSGFDESLVDSTVAENCASFGSIQNMSDMRSALGMGSGSLPQVALGTGTVDQQQQYDQSYLSGTSYPYNMQDDGVQHVSPLQSPCAALVLQQQHQRQLEYLEQQQHAHQLQYTSGTLLSPQRHAVQSPPPQAPQAAYSPTSMTTALLEHLIRAQQQSAAHTQQLLSPLSPQNWQYEHSLSAINMQTPGSPTDWQYKQQASLPPATPYPVFRPTMGHSAPASPQMLPMEAQQLSERDWMAYSMSRR